MIRSNGIGETEYVGLLRSIFEFLLMSGSDLRSIRMIVDRALSETTRRNRVAKNTSGDAGIAAASRVLDAWHRDRRYLNKHAEPRAIPLLGRAPSVEALVRMEKSGRDSAEFARRLRGLGLLIGSGRGRYKPAMRVALIGAPNQLVQQYVARSSAALFQTIRYNVSRPSLSNRLIERFTEVPDLPARHAVAFRKFSHEQGMVLLNTLNDWLEARRSRSSTRGRGRCVRAGLHLYAYLDRSTLAQSRRNRTKGRVSG
jgi:hypothetical protein